MMRRHILLMCWISVIFTLAQLRESCCCNKAYCAAVVSKCMLLRTCECDYRKECHCCKNCSMCLGNMWTECCDCVNMCPPKNSTESPPTSRSAVEDLPDSVPSLYSVLVEQTGLKWTVMTFPVIREFQQPDKTTETSGNQGVSFYHTTVNDKNVTIIGECTVVYFDDCMSRPQCRTSCESMGAASYRWFHNACCECVGPTCIDYGRNAVHCSNCLD